MSTPIGRLALAAAALAALLAGCAAPAPVSAPAATAEAPASTPSVEPEPAPSVQFTCSDLDDAVPAGFSAGVPFGSAPSLATTAVGGASCEWLPTTASGAVERVFVTLLPAELLDGPTTLAPTCGELLDFSPGCYSQELIDGLVAETVIMGNAADAETSRVLDSVASATRERLAEGARPLAADVSLAPRVGCQTLQLSATQLPGDVGSFVMEFGGTDAGAPISPLVSTAMQSMDGRVGCGTMTALGFGVGMATLGGGANLLDDPRLIGDSVPLELASGRPARILVGTSEYVPELSVARVAIDIDGSLVFLFINDRSTSTDAASIDQAAVAIADAVVSAIDARA